MLERYLAWRYRRRIARARRHFQPQLERVRACKHTNREPRPIATGIARRGGSAQRCLDCGVGIVTIPRKEGE